MAIAAIILAGGQGRRMASGRAKVMHTVGGRTMLEWVAGLVGRIGCDRVVVVVPAGDRMVSDAAVRLFGHASICEQVRPLGTGDAVRAAVSSLAGFKGEVVVLYADTPLVSVKTARSALAAAREDGLAVVGFEPVSPRGYGRLVMEGGHVRAIVEERDASDAERDIELCNSGVLASSWPLLENWLERLVPSAATGEYYLTDAVSLAVLDACRPKLVMAHTDEVAGVNTLSDLARVEAAFQARARDEALSAGVQMCAPQTVYFSHDTRAGKGVIIDPYVVIGPGTSIGDGAHIGSFTHIEGAQIASGATIGPFARLRPGSDIASGARIGNFVEVKNARIGQDAKASHLAYVGDAEIGDRANIGAGSICCNYDGLTKHRTVVGADAFIGSNSALVAPVEIGDNACVGSGSVIVSDVEKDSLALARARQTAKPGWAAARRRVSRSGGDDG